MSDHAILKSDRNEDQKLLLSSTKSSEPWVPYQSKWVTRWMQTSSTSSSPGCKQHVVSGASNKDLREKKGYFVVETVKPKGTSIFSEDMTRRNAFKCITTQKYVSKEFNQSQGILQPSRDVRAEDEKLNIISNSLVRNISCSDSKAQILPDYFTIKKNVTMLHDMNSENMSSMGKHFPMFNVKRKIESALAPKNQFGCSTIYGTMSKSHMPLCESTLAPRVIEFESEEHHFEAHSISQSTNKVLRPHESLKGLLPRRDDLFGTSRSTVHRFKCYGSKLRSCMCTRKKNDPFTYGEQFASTNLTCLNTCNCCKHSTFTVSEMEIGNEMLRSSGNSWTRSKDGPMQVLRDPSTGDTLYLSGEHDKETKTISDRKLLPINKSIHSLSKIQDSQCLCELHKMPECSVHGVDALGACTTSNSLDNTKLKPQGISNATNCLFGEKMDMDSFHGDKMIMKSTICAEVQEAAFFDTHTLPSILDCQCHHVADLQPLVSSTNGEDGDSINTHFMELQSGWSDKTNIVHMNGSQVPGSPTDLTSSNIQKDVICGSIRELSTTKTGSIDTDHIFAHSEKLESNFPLHESASSPDPSNRWVKRLRHNPVDSLALASKRFKKGDDSYRLQSQNLFHQTLDKCFEDQHEESQNMFHRTLDKCLEEQQKIDTKCSYAESKAMNNWIGRWCHGSQRAAPLPKQEVHEASVRKQFPSITAMALMGASLKNFRRCQVQMKGSLLVWK